ncbi:DUF6179 domain-containing protein [Clostridium manihotivorum]|uniref:Uncharacterized protein n=1 Tax=Clostridium manihotivorum TaxID=2320868 RepID=A0A410DSY4_9CLOT|nr:DUF6179 domain-containing protein [Clostridium manihotivorum]QAA32118.1 hypothetical protein C1I91_10890 [Clostridium manihotivorum]
MENFIINQEESLLGLVSKEHYFQSMLQLLYSNKLLSTKQLEKVQFQLIELLEETVSYYTRYESSSVRVEVAEQIMLSICFTIGLYLKQQSTMKDNIALIKNAGVKQLFKEGEKILRDKVELCKSLLNNIYETRLNTETYAYTDTIDYGIPLFFKEYDTRFASHDMPGSIDYQLAIDVRNLTGVECLEEYLNRLRVENKFCAFFNGEDIEALLKGFKKDYIHMLINIFQLVLTNSLGCVLVGKAAVLLDLNEGDRVYISSRMEGLSSEQIEKLIFSAGAKLCDELSIIDEELIKYIREVSKEIIIQLENALEIDKLEKVFITLKRSEDNIFKYEDGEVLTNSEFRKITEEIRACKNPEEKITIIREGLHSLKDLIDTLGADCIFEDEFIEIFKSLNEFEMALLIKSTSTSKAFDNEYGSESEKEWQRKLKEYLEALDASRKAEIFRIAEGLEV